MFSCVNLLPLTQTLNLKYGPTLLLSSVLLLLLLLLLLILLEIRVKKAQAPYTCVCVPVFVHLQNADLVLTSHLRFSQHRGLAGLVRACL